jgi:hypothetical protein
MPETARHELVRRALQAFRADADALPPLTLRGGNAVDGYDEAEPFNAALDEPTDTYIGMTSAPTRPKRSCMVSTVTVAVTSRRLL